MLPLTDDICARALADVNALSDDALSTLSVAYRTLGPEETPAAQADIEHELIFVDTVGIIDPPREEARQAILEAQQVGIRAGHQLPR